MITLDKDILPASYRMLLLFGAPWCGPCKSLRPKVEALQKQYASVGFYYASVDVCPKLATRFGVTSVPMVVLLRAEQVVHVEYNAGPNTIVRLCEHLTKLVA